ncbi:PREDICTED: GTP cyclohydrolase 1 feedback regulatory protein [Aptenodytes forsteri]|nr:PREDICTED: GTP cyclohydrolase 1 feedback regulatory protein [Aptenodytes forsteri]
MVQKANRQAGRSLVKDAAAVIEDVPLHTRLKPSEQRMENEDVWGCCGTEASEVGPTMVGDEHSDPSLMSFLGATKRNMLGNHFWEYYVNDAPRIVLNKLESCGYRVVSMTGVGQTLVWCLHKE